MGSSSCYQTNSGPRVSLFFLNADLFLYLIVNVSDQINPRLNESETKLVGNMFILLETELVNAIIILIFQIVTF